MIQNAKKEILRLGVCPDIRRLLAPAFCAYPTATTAHVKDQQVETCLSFFLAGLTDVLELDLGPGPQTPRLQ